MSTAKPTVIDDTVRLDINKSVWEAAKLPLDRAVHVSPTEHGLHISGEDKDMDLFMKIYEQVETQFYNELKELANR